MREFIDGATALARGALDAGCDFFAGYPITPASPILMSMMREMPKVGGISIEAEDEIASIGMCIGAVQSGRRAMTATSGPGISLYSENIGVAIMGEVPLVIVDVQRLGPATGAATTVGQGDVNFVRWGTGGGYPIIALAPSSLTECYSLTRRAFDLAERFRCPVFLLTDKELVATAATVEIADYEAPPVRPRAVAAASEDFRPYTFEPAGDVPPMAHYGEEVVLRFTGSTHDEGAFITKDPVTVGKLNRHLVAKIEEHTDEIELTVSDLEDGATELLVSYGVTAGAMRAAVRNMRAAGRRVSSLTIQSLWPVPERAIERALDGVERVVVAELNPGQYVAEIERIAGRGRVVGIH
ncbi:MAG TPA: pyruvate flavodoxin/ferredoxin oxidoreductase, partial [Planctomycetes bacterium]|nr:pyruvate flavodoxin/ferredoxin oxidoreductase [Planctomycetota bacterium]